MKLSKMFSAYALFITLSSSTHATDLHAPPKPFTDYRFQKPGQMHLIRINDLPPAQRTFTIHPASVVDRPETAWPKVPPGFKVQLFVSGLDRPRLLRTAPNGDIFLAESNSGEIKVFRGITPDGKPQHAEIFISGLKKPYGIAFYPPGKNPQWIYVANTNAIVRFPYKNGDLHTTQAPQQIATLPSAFTGHWTRDIQFSLDGKKMFVSVGSVSNANDDAREKDRANILVMNPDGSNMQIFASGVRNAGGGLAIQPATGKLWASVNERDGLGDNLVPDYITQVKENGFYGWPWWYMGPYQDPRHAGKHPELKDKVITPDVLLQPHSASLQMTFYEGKQFPATYHGDIFASQHGSWNRSVLTGYEVIRVLLHQTGKASGEYEDFMTGFVIDNNHVWGRPVGVTVAADGSLLVSDDGSNSIWRVAYVG